MNPWERRLLSMVTIVGGAVACSLPISRLLSVWRADQRICRKKNLSKKSRPRGSAEEASASGREELLVDCAQDVSGDCEGEVEDCQSAADGGRSACGGRIAAVSPASSREDADGRGG
ncbi:MAG: hypothetical protein LiPW15_592 [Parcubacteria group bacterium LiPW_15]|nr:MAG: hypothetical protein LiPW15_592 [Parcubacteria group bacterium LiPW_15]